FSISCSATATYPLSLHDALPISDGLWLDDGWGVVGRFSIVYASNGARVMYARGRYKQWFLPTIHGRAVVVIEYGAEPAANGKSVDRKSTRLNSSHEWISYAVLCL